MKIQMLDAEEKQIVDLFERGELKRSKNRAGELVSLRQAARATLRKNKRINIRLSEKDLMGIKARAAEEGMPYQTLISSLIHKYLAGSLLEKRKA